MKPGFRQCMAWLHVWSGLVVGWILFAVFLTGTAAYLRPEITNWMRPELQAAPSGPAAAQAVLDHLAQAAPRSASWFVTLPDARQPAIQAFWREGGALRNGWFAPGTGAPLALRETSGGEFFYRFHFQLHYLNVPLARWIVSACGMVMLVSILSGIVTHRRIFADLFTVRPGKGPRSWLDAHVLAAVAALPYHLVITYSGLVTLMLMTLPWGVQAAYRGEPGRFAAEVFGTAPPERPAGQPAPLAAVAPLMAEAMRLWEGGSVGRIAVQNPGDARAAILLARRDSESIASIPQTLLFDGVSGALRHRTGEAAGPMAATRGLLYGLHIGRFAGPALRALLILSGLAGTAMVATGCILWALKARHKAARAGRRAGFGLRLVEHLNIAAIAGLPVAMAAFLWANRLLPPGMAGRAAWEIHLFFIAWGFCLLHPLLRPGLRGWIDQTALAALLFALLPALNAATTDRHLGRSLAAGDWGMAGFDLGLLATGAALGAIAWRLARRPGPAWTKAAWAAAK